MLRIAVLVLLGGALVVWGRATWKNPTTLDPMDQRYTDHLRVRYCAALVLEQPLHALRTPVGELAAADPRASKSPFWAELPCHQPGLVHLAIHAPFQWAVDGAWVSDLTASRLAVLVFLLFAHAAVALLVLERRWWGLLLYPLAVRCALNALQEPIPLFFAVASGLMWSRGKRLASLAFAVVAFSAYNRWAVWLLGIALLCVSERALVKAELNTLLARGPGRLYAVLVTALALVSLAGTLWVSSAWSPPPSAFGPREYLALGAAVLLCAGYMVRLESVSATATLLLLGALFLIAYRTLAPYWYVSMALPAVALARRRSEIALWAAYTVVLPDAVFHIGVWPSAAGTLLWG